MEYNVNEKKIYSNKILNELDKFVIDFIGIIKKYTNYVIVSGYVSILLGRSRGSEDVDLLIPEMTFFQFKRMFEELTNKGYECANTYEKKEAYEMLNEHAIRFFKDTPIPNIEFKKITNSIQEEAYRERLKVIIRKDILFISPLELQIAYKLSLVSKGDFSEISSDKDFEDAKHLYETFKEKLNKEQLSKYIKLFKIENIWKILENENY